MLAGCASEQTAKSSEQAPDKLVVYSDGTMKFKKRRLPEKDVVIYPDGFGGERAAVKMRVPLHPDFYRDSIIVERKPQLEKVSIDNK
ncbi:MAG: hypothetical protein ACE5GZ_10290 [Gammaproteobacteria bacterium]